MALADIRLCPGVIGGQRRLGLVAEKAPRTVKDRPSRGRLRGSEFQSRPRPERRFTAPAYPKEVPVTDRGIQPS